MPETRFLQSERMNFSPQRWGSLEVNEINVYEVDYNETKYRTIPYKIPLAPNFVGQVILTDIGKLMICELRHVLEAGHDYVSDPFDDYGASWATQICNNPDENVIRYKYQKGEAVGPQLEVTGINFVNIDNGICWMEETQDIEQLQQLALDPRLYIKIFRRLRQETNTQNCQTDLPEP